MKKLLSAKTVLILSGLVLIVFVSCYKEDIKQPEFKKDRITFMSSNVMISVVRPLQDTINFKDATSGFTMNIENGELTTRTYEFSDTIFIQNKSKDFKVTMEFDNFHYNEANNTFGFGGKGVLYMKERKVFEWQEVTPLVVLPVKGSIVGKSVTYKIAGNPGKDEREPYVAINYIGSVID